MSHSRTFTNGFKHFRNRYKNWLNEIEIDDTENEHPWHQYRIPIETDVRHYKDKESKTHFKPRHIALFKQKTSPKHLAEKGMKKTTDLVKQ